MIPPVAYVLGNGPTLQPLEYLQALASSFTIGVNRIMLSGFTPTVLLTVDDDINAECAATAAASGVLVVTGAARGKWPATQIELRAGDSAWTSEPTPRRLHASGSSGVAAARWARALGCSVVYLLGMSATYADGMTDFYGVNGQHEAGTLSTLRAETDRLLASWSGYVPADDLCLDALADGDDVDQDALRAHLIEVLS